MCQAVFILYSEDNMAQVKILVKGYLAADNDGRTASTVSLVLDDDVVMVVDPGFLEDRQVLVEALNEENLSPDDVNIVCITHSHIDHYANMGMFKNAKVLEYYGMWDNEGRIENWQQNFTSDIQILKTPGHDRTCITLFVKTDDGIVAICGDVFWKKNYPEIDEYAADLKKLEQSRKLVLKMAHWIVPGHDAMYSTQNGYRLQETKNGKKVKTPIIGKCKKCRRSLTRLKDRCACQNWLCYRCCECDMDCAVCSCKHRIK